MNKVRRKALQDLFDVISEAQEKLEQLRDEEEEYKENMPENLQGSERYWTADAAVDALDSALDSLQEALDSIEEVIS